MKPDDTTPHGTLLATAVAGVAGLAALAASIAVIKAGDQDTVPVTFESFSSLFGLLVMILSPIAFLLSGAIGIPLSRILIRKDKLRLWPFSAIGAVSGLIAGPLIWQLFFAGWHEQTMIIGASVGFVAGTAFGLTVLVRN